jgi:hypothetical protein
VLLRRIFSSLTRFSWCVHCWRNLQRRSRLCLPLPRLHERRPELSCVSPPPDPTTAVLTNIRYYWITQAFESTSGSISNLVNGVNALISDCLDTTLLGTFMENHDNPRFPSLTSDLSLAKNAIAFTILADGIPISKLMRATIPCYIKLTMQSLLWPRTTFLRWRRSQ